MSSILRKPLLLLLFLVASLVAAVPARACNVPVFRYALERWPADRYVVVLFHKGMLSADHQSLADALARASDPETSSTNIVFHQVDLAKESAEVAAKLFEDQPKAELPWLLVRYPREVGIKANVWAGRLDRTVVQTLLDSPARQEIGKRILAGESAVWILLESGQKDKDDAAAQLLQRQLQALPKVLQLPALTSSPQDKIDEDGPPLQIAFSMLRVARTDPAEKMLVQMLLHLEDDLLQFAEPMVFAVFGRGRCLLPMVGKGITEENIRGDAASLVAACSCEIKRQNPGVDLLLSVPWEERIKGRATQAALPETAGLVPVAVPKGLPPAPSSGVVPGTNPPRTADPPAGAIRPWLVGGLIGFGILTLGVIAFLPKVQGRNRGGQAKAPE